MNKFRKTAIGIVAMELLFVLIGNLFLLSRQSSEDDGRAYRVEAGRVVREIEKMYAENLMEDRVENPKEHIEKLLKTIDLSKYSAILRVSLYDADTYCNNDYLVEKIGDTLYRIEYRRERRYSTLVFANVLAGVMVMITIGIFAYIDRKLLTPFYRMQHLPVELAKGKLAVPLKEEKSRFFGRFLWGMDMLRENLEEKREKEMELQKEHKTLILSLSHDIRTPLAAIELYTKALSENLYETDGKREDAYRGITKNVGIIKNYVNEITKASREDFLNLEVNEGEFYLSEAMNYIKEYYREKLEVLHTEFEVADVPDCMLYGDKERIIEILQNILENAIKYGDGNRIDIAFDDEEDCKLVRISNTGAVPAEEEMPHLFDSFYRGSNHKNIKGSGLGLYICKNLMIKMNGAIYAECGREVFRVTVVIRKA